MGDDVGVSGGDQAVDTDDEGIDCCMEGGINECSAEHVDKHGKGRYGGQSEEWE